ncbi:hypothetical protein [Curtobacterium sp. MCBD17_019]|uniref:hypothetical protein n=1 Tax=Curtobacterium sp. MCBD17_019 TaxID=2175669 RepID=UPI000DA958C5|nr:hypothetical protein [Curtobacterium sp. MCBD17_019]PZE74094.1 hypothetical protein DEI82_12170 [Curtobacterium sp. MCBD17_019]
MRRLWYWLRGHDDEQGAALVAVVGVGAVLMVLAATMLGVAASGTVKSSADEDWTNAMSAAYAGLADYQSKLTADNSYTQYGNPASSFSAGSTFTGQASNPAFSIAAGSWVSVPTSNTGGVKEYYRYEVNNRNYYSNGVIKVRVTGKSGNATRSLVADLKGTGFIDYLYFTDYEVSDPAITGSTCTPEHLTDSGYSSRVDCNRIQFASADVLEGPVRTNDEFTICGATFDMSVESTAADGAYVKPTGCNSPTFNKAYNGGRTKHVPSIALPATNANLKQETRSDLTSSTVPNPGCLYTGPTSIVFNSDGTMTVRSPWTKKTEIAGDPASSGTTPAACGTVGTGTNQLGSTAGQTLAVPNQNLLYVQNVPATTGDPNYWASNAQPNTKSCKGADGTTTGNGIGWPLTNEDTSQLDATTPYGCRNGDVFVSGTVNAKATVAAQNYVYVTGNLTYQDKKDDILGLVGQQAVWVSNPVSKSTSCSYFGCSTSYTPINGYKDREIDAAIASNEGTFTVQNYDQGSKSLGTLTVYGSIAQKFRGPVAQSSTGGNVGSGYVKDYQYDARLQYEAPPKFLQPVSTNYGITTQVEVKAAYKPDGTPTS